MRYVAAARTDVGRKRQGTEDTFCLEPTLGLYVVADGMGGHAAGEVASRLAVDTIREWMKKYLNGAVAAMVGPAAAGSPEANFLLSSIRLANRIVFDAAKDSREIADTFTMAAWIKPQGQIPLPAERKAAVAFQDQNWAVFPAPAQVLLETTT